MSFNLDNIQIALDLRKREEKTVLTITSKDLELNEDKILTILRKENVDLHSWFYILVSFTFY